MSRFAVAQLPTQPYPRHDNEDGDAIFLGLDMTTPKEYLPAGYYPLAINNRVTDGRATPRGGTVKPAFANAMPFTSILGSGVYSNPNNLAVLLIATPTAIYALADKNYPQQIPIPTGITLSGACTFDQNFDKVYLNNANVTLVWDGLSPKGFVVNTQQSPNNTLLKITPNVQWSQNVANRRVFPLSNDSIGVTPILDYTEYNLNPLNQAPNIGVFRINTGTADNLVGVFPYAQSNLIVAKRFSIDILANFTGDLATAQLGTLSSQIGLISRKAAQMVGADMIFPFDTGVYRIQQVLQDRLAASPMPVAAHTDQYGNVVDPIAPLLKRINWSFSSLITAAVIGPYYFLAVPLDGATFNNAVLVYNTIKDKWEGYDTWPQGQLQVDDLWVLPYQNSISLFCVDNRAKAIYVLYEGKTDLLAGGEFQVSHTIETRGYATLASLNQFKRVEIGCSTWNPSTTISELTDKAYDVRPLTTIPVTKSRTKYSIFGVPDYDPSNINNDFSRVGRQDYSVPDGVYYDNGGSGINIEQAQQSVFKFATMARGRWISYRIQNNQGICAVDGVLMRSTTAERQQGARAA